MPETSDIGMIIINLPNMKDQNSIPKENQDQRWNRALDIFIESVLKPDPTLRGCAHNQKCYNELMWIREDILEHLNHLRR